MEASRFQEVSCRLAAREPFIQRGRRARKAMILRVSWGPTGLAEDP